MWQFFADNPWVAVFAVITLGALLGMVRFGPVRLGAAGVLFVGLLVGALDEDIAAAVPAGVSALGLALYVYTVGLESGPAFFRELRGQLPVMAGAVVALAVTAAVVGFVGHRGFGIAGPFLAGGYAGIGTTTPGLAAAQDASEDPTQPAVGYAIGYPLAVVITIVFVSAIAARRHWTARRDPGSGLPATLVTRTVQVARDLRWADVPGAAAHRVLASEYRPADGVTRVARELDRLSPGDQVVLVGGDEDVRAATDALGSTAPRHLLDDRSAVDYRRVLLTNPDLAGHTVGELGLGEKYGALVSRVRRGDFDMLAHDDLLLQLDDRVRVVMPRERTGEVTRYLGDTEAEVSEVSAVSLGLGLTLGFLIGIPSLTLGSTTLALGTGAGPLVMGMVLGWRRRTGPLVWTLPTRANLTLRQIGLLPLPRRRGAHLGLLVPGERLLPLRAEAGGRAGDRRGRQLRPAGAGREGAGAEPGADHGTAVGLRRQPGDRGVRQQPGERQPDQQRLLDAVRARHPGQDRLHPADRGPLTPARPVRG
ncbi:Putative transport protein YidE [Streptomyces griseus subsp. griseus]